MLREHEELLQALLTAQLACLNHAQADSPLDDREDLRDLRVSLEECRRRFRDLERRMRRLAKQTKSPFM